MNQKSIYFTFIIIKDVVVEQQYSFMHFVCTWHRPCVFRTLVIIANEDEDDDDDDEDLTVPGHSPGT